MFDAEGVKAASAVIIDKGMMLLPNVAPGSGPFPGESKRWIERG